MMRSNGSSQPTPLVRLPMAHNRQHVSHGKEAYCIVCILIALVLGVLSIVGPGGYLDFKKAQAELESQRLRIESLRRSNAEKARTVEALANSLDAIEELARQKEYGKKGELVQEMRPAESQSTATGNGKPRTGK